MPGCERPPTVRDVGSARVRCRGGVAPGQATVAAFTPGLSPGDLRSRVVGHVAPEAGTVSLTDARVVVGGGRGVGSAEGFAELEELAALLGGTVGVSRVVTSAGWRPLPEQVGQTGARIAPELYIACGISGAIQHIVGCRSASGSSPSAPTPTRRSSPRRLRGDRRPPRGRAGHQCRDPSGHGFLTGRRSAAAP